MKILAFIAEVLYKAWLDLAPGLRVLLCILSAAFAVWAIVEAVNQIKKRTYVPSAVLMIIGGLILTAAIVVNIKEMLFDFLYALFGCAAICAAAVWNGVKSKRYRVYHPVLRILLSLLILTGFGLL